MNINKNDWVHRILSGSPITPEELRFAGWIAGVWFLMDLVQWIDWLVGKLK